jgi:hypothetical protein
MNIKINELKSKLSTEWVDYRIKIDFGDHDWCDVIQNEIDFIKYSGKMFIIDFEAVNKELDKIKNASVTNFEECQKVMEQYKKFKEQWSITTQLIIKYNEALHFADELKFKLRADFKGSFQCEVFEEVTTVCIKVMSNG